MTNDQDVLLKLLDKHIELYKFYFEIAIKINLFFYGITGAILSYYFAHSAGNEQIKLALFVPVMLAALLIVILGYGSRTLVPVQEEITQIADSLDTYSVIDITALKLFLQASVVVFALTMFGILFGVIWN